MAITVNEIGGDQVVITIGETFDFSCVESFRKAYEYEPKSGGKKEFVLDLRHTHYMDSSALGMLINMNKYWEGRIVGSIRIINCNPQIKKIFTISRFDKKFTIE